jgi:Effector-associated domain 7
MASAEEIAHQQTLLTTYRRNLAHYLKQQAAQGGEAYVMPGVVNGIIEARSNIQRIKQILRGWGVHSADHPDDGDAPVGQTPAAQTSAVAPTIDRVTLRNILVSRFSDNELRDLVFDLGEDYENLPGEGKAAKARELVAFAERRGRTSELVALIRHLRPDSMPT